jgi:preprotein translocase subunit SecD
VSVSGETLDQHFAVALDSQLLTVPQIDFHAYPDGVLGATSADVTGGLTAQSARDLATELRLGALPLNLRRVGP